MLKKSEIYILFTSDSNAATSTRTDILVTKTLVGMKTGIEI